MPTSATTNSDRASENKKPWFFSDKGFTLLELMVVLAIIAGAAAFVLPKISNRNRDMRVAVRKFTVLSRDLKNKAKLQNATYRLVIDLGEDENKPDQSFWVERAKGEVLNDYDPKNPPKPPKTQDSDDTASSRDDDDEEEQDKNEFIPDVSIYKRPEQLPGSLLFDGVELGNLDKKVTTGIIYIHYFPSGLADEAAIHLKSGDKLRWTIIINPLTALATVIDSDKPLSDLRAK